MVQDEHARIKRASSNSPQKEALSTLPVRLSSGRESNYYVDCRLITVNPVDHC